MSKMKLYSEKSDVIYVAQNKDPFFEYLTRKVFQEVDWSKKNGRLLDLGCGSGRLSFEAARRGFQAVGLDYVQKVIDLANAEAKARGMENRAVFYQADLLKLKPREYGLFDYVVLMEVIEHIDDYRKVLDFAYHSLKKGGKLLLTTPNDPTLWTVLDDYAQHVRRLTLTEVHGSLTKFSKVKIGTVGYPLHRFFMSIYHRFMQARKLKHKPKLFRLNPFIAISYYIIGTIVMSFDDLFAYRDKGTTIVAIAEK